jgi:hypothetical protein
MLTHKDILLGFTITWGSHGQPLMQLQLQMFHNITERCSCYASLCPSKGHKTAKYLQEQQQRMCLRPCRTFRQQAAAPCSTCDSQLPAASIAIRLYHGHLACPVLEAHKRAIT